MAVKPYLAVGVVALLFTLAACGKKGDLILPGPPPAATASHTP